MLGVIMLIFAILYDIMLNVVMLSVVALSIGIAGIAGIPNYMFISDTIVTK